MSHTELIPHLFRTESGKITTVLCKLFGIEHLEVAEDLTGETFLAALETWTYKGIPENPTAWLYAVAKNKAKNYLLRNRVFYEKVVPQLQHATPPSEDPEVDLSGKNITDSQLQMLFAICHPALAPEAQVALALRLLCGFGIDEIATAFLTGKETVNKRLFRAKEKLRQLSVPIEFPPHSELPKRLEAVLTTLYLLFNEGYYSESQDAVLREDLCLEAVRLAHLLTEHEPTAQPATYALLALMCFHASRFPARRSENGELILYAEQDESLWNGELIAQGAYFLQRAAQGNTVTRYHLEAAIAWWHTHKADTPEKWENILQLYNQLLCTAYSPIAALNRTFALSKVAGQEAAIAEAQKLSLTGNPYYHTLLGELYSSVDTNKARAHLEEALCLARTQADRQTIQKKIDSL